MKRKALPEPDRNELYRTHVHAAKIALEAAAKTTGIAKMLNEADARSHTLAALKLMQRHEVPRDPAPAHLSREPPGDAYPAGAAKAADIMG